MATLSLARRELSGLFYSAIAYVVLALFLLFLGFLFGSLIFVPGRVSDMREMFIFSRFALVFVVPLMTMSLLSEEYKSGRIEMLRTSPITDAQIIFGKYLGAMGFYCVLVASTLIYVILLSIFGRPDYGSILASYLGMLLMGSLFVSVGLFFSACTQNQIVAAMSGILTLAVLAIIVGIVATHVPTPYAHLLLYIAVGTHLQDFAKGIVDTSHVVYFLTGTFLFLFLTYVLLESRKWR